MRLLGKNLLEEFKKKHSRSRSGLERWQKIVEGTNFNNFVELRKTFPSADIVGNKTVFNVGGNRIRTITLIQYGIHQIIVTHVLTHEEYDRGKWK